ncbi:MAG: prolyl oligopeptidase family serine peptidase [Candidatus Hydrogenedens sp.]|nr:alpha/beta hydrolase [Candidatus Hydrogenedentota bacterium]NLF58302.1 prolyl oligopeptidase family serine peptidase [Candidatus Hydrogenedens sp.]
MRWPRDAWSRRVLRDGLLAREDADFEDTYARNYMPGLTKPPEVGRPFFLKPWGRVRGGVVLSHGYMAAPLEVRALGEHLRRAGYAVYGVRLAGHGTAPQDLSARAWSDWYASVERGCGVINAFTDNLILGGFSTGGCLALIGAARMPDRVRAVFSVCAPLHVRNFSIRFAPSLVGLNSLLKRFGAARPGWDYVENHPENRHINYTRNPLTGVRELVGVMAETERILPEVTAPALVVQGSEDTTVHPDSGPEIFAKLGSAQKELTILARNRHGIVNGEGSEEVFSRVAGFLRQAAPGRSWRGVLVLPRLHESPKPSAVEAALTPELEAVPDTVEEPEAAGERISSTG